MTGTYALYNQDRVWEMLQAAPDGRTVYDMAYELGVHFGTVGQYIRNLRKEHSSDTINIVCDRDPVNPTGPQLYTLAGSYSATAPWMGTRFQDSESRLEVIRALAESVMHATNGRTKEGRKASATYKHLGRLLEDLADIEASL